MKVKSVTEKINESLKAHVDSEDDSEEEAQVVDFDYDEYELPKLAKSTDFRKRNIKLLSEQSSKYKGKIVSRKELNSEDDSEDDKITENSDSEEDEDSNDGAQSSAEEVEEGSDESDMENYLEGGEEESDDGDDGSSLEADDDTNEDAIAEGKRQEDEIRKGFCVQNQLRIWERLLEIRIRTQKLLSKSNQLPLPIDQPDYETDIAEETKEKTCLLLKNLLELKSSLTTQFTELRTHMKRLLQENSALGKYESGEPPFKRIAAQLEDQHSHMRSYRNAVLLKWDDRTKLLTPGAGSKRKMNEEFDVVRKIDNALLSRDILITKSRKVRNAEDCTADDPTEEQTEKEDPNVYDDSDFYHQQLRELIEFKANSASNVAEVTKQVVELQNIRQKMKKKVDTRASKGRKIRYIVHNKLVNFMAPDDTTSVNWPDESKDELYKSLFAT